MNLNPVQVMMTAMILTSLVAWADGPLAAELPRVNVPTLTAAPTIDGVISPGEWDSASGAPLLRGADGRYTTPHAHFRIGRFGNTLYIAGWVNTLPEMPVARHERRDAPLWEDDSLQFGFQAGSAAVQFLVNAKGVIYDELNGAASWDGPWQVAARRIGYAESIGEGTVERGFAFEAALPLEAAGLPVPTDGTQWGFQAGLLLGGQSRAVWNGTAGMGFHGQFAPLIWGGPPTTIESIQRLEAGRRLTVTGRSGGELVLEISPTGAAPMRDSLKAGPWTVTHDLPGGTEYALSVAGPQFHFLLADKAAPLVPVVAVPAPSRGAFYIALDPAKLGAVAGQVLHLRLERDGKALWQQSVATDTLKTKTVYWPSYEGWGPGWINLVVEASRAGRTQEVARTALSVPKRPVWLDFTMPTNAPVVPKPYTPVVAEPKAVRVYGRTYQLGQSPFLDQVESAGAPILAAPVTLRGRVNGQPIAWRMKSWRQVAATAEKATYAAEAESAGLRLAVTTTIEFDGMARFDWTLTPLGTKVTVEDLALVMPVRLAVARFYHHSAFEGFTFNNLETWNKAGALPANGWSGPFTPFFWLGDYERGIQWFAESRVGWTPRDPKKYLTVEPGAKAVELVAHLADEPRALTAPWSATFGLMASPIRPRPSPDDWSGNRVILGFQAGIFTQPNDPMRKSAIILGTGPEDCPKVGSVELVFRPDVPTVNPPPADAEIVLFVTTADSGGASGFRLAWDGARRELVLSSHTGSAFWGNKAVARWPANLEQGRWHRLVFNYGPDMEVWLDGVKVGGCKYTGPLQNWDRLRYQQIGGSGRISLAGWRLSRGHRPGDPGPVSSWKPDDQTLHLETLATDPTVMNLTDPVVGGVRNPGYLEGNWSYDPTNRWLIAGPDREPMTSVEHQHKYYGARNAIFFHWSQRICGHGGLAQTEYMPKLIEITRAMNFRLLPYTPNGMTDKDPAYADYKYECSALDPSQEPQPWWTESGERLFSAPPGGHLDQYELWRINEIMKWGAGGLYMDGWFYVGEVANPLLDAQVVDPLSGKVVPYFPIFAKRELNKKVARLIQAYDPDALVLAHNSGGSQLPVMMFVTDACNGESLAWHPDWPKYVEPDVIAAEHMGRAWGWNSALFAYQNQPVPPEYGMAIAGVHGMTTGFRQWGMYPQRAEKVWALADRFGTATAEWMPYYYPERNAFQPRDKRVLASAFVHRGKRALLLATNWSDAPCDGRIRVDFKALGLKPDVRVRLLNHNTMLSVREGELTLPLKPRRLYYVWLGPE